MIAPQFSKTGRPASHQNTCHLYSRDDFKLNRTEVLAEKRQLYSG